MTPQPVRIAVELPAGPAEVSGLWSAPAQSRATLALAHGAGAGMEHPFLAGLSDALTADGVAVNSTSDRMMKMVSGSVTSSPVRVA